MAPSFLTPKMEDLTTRRHRQTLLRTRANMNLKEVKDRGDTAVDQNSDLTDLANLIMEAVREHGQRSNLVTHSAPATPPHDTDFSRDTAGADCSAQFAKLDTADFDSLVEFGDTLERLPIPALCLATTEEAPSVIDYLRETDDLAIKGENASLIQWRESRILHTIAKQLDPLTKAISRSTLVKQMEPLCRDANQTNPVSVILVDIDHFKGINDEFGHTCGDKLLIGLSQRLTQLCRGAMVARTRNAEFAILIPSTEDYALRIAEIIHQTLSDHHWCPDEKANVSLGVACVESNCEPSRLLARSDQALYSAKATGRNRVVSYSRITSISNRHDDDLEVVTMENKARVLSERLTSFVAQRSKRIVSALRIEANTDPLTGLHNRRYLERQLDVEFRKVMEKEMDLCVALIDLDHFGVVNKQHGWPTGDKILREVSEKINSSIRNADWVGRYGGEEICLVMPRTESTQAIAVCNRIRTDVAATKFETTSGDPMQVTLSVGVIQIDPAVDETPTQAFERVSQLTLLAKTNGRNQVRA